MAWKTSPRRSRKLLINRCYLPATFRRPNSAHEIIEAVLERFARIDILINNAGASLGGDIVRHRAGRSQIIVSDERRNPFCPE